MVGEVADGVLSTCPVDVMAAGWIVAEANHLAPGQPPSGGGGLVHMRRVLPPNTHGPHQ